MTMDSPSLCTGDAATGATRALGGRGGAAAAGPTSASSPRKRVHDDETEWQKKWYPSVDRDLCS